MTAIGRHRVILSLAFVLIIPKACYKEAPVNEPEAWNGPYRVLEFNGVYAFADTEDKLLLYPLSSDTVTSFAPIVGFGDFQSIEIDGRKMKKDEVNELGRVVINHAYEISARREEKTEIYQLYFTNLPLVQIHTDIQIRDEPKVPSVLEISSPEIQDNAGETGLYTSFAGIEIRGRTSAVYEKKSYGLELWEKWYGNDKQESLLGMRKSEDWILDAMYIDPLRMRNKLSFELWAGMCSSKNMMPAGSGQPAVQAKYVELFINQRYMGLYTLSEKLDESLLDLSGGAPGSEGVLYKAFDWNEGGTDFKTYNSEPDNSIIWEGWEQLYPDRYACWGPLEELRKAVVFDEDEFFPEHIGTLLNLDEAAAYYLFINLILAHDNIIKNYFLAKYPYESQFLVLPWDLEASWGIMWDGGESSSNGMLDNGLFHRLRQLDVEEFNDKLEDSWKQYRKSIFQLDTLLLPVYEYTSDLKRSGVIDRENSRWENAHIDIDRELQYLCQWITLRLDYLDLEFD